ncbi:hydantoinase B/oxoprolinase family protein [Rhodococcus opacus]|uniref:hydantoinase B/oxoprolinase family protein n=1 Tax=Rhodococcus opacus TaxID=37919 RepID=UPI00247496FE|nr:hydantoinase B/oxoprolinase family protein [Rhodococcus opacus]MDH6288232.1 N-methylhydantoinase B [Rhodococcus opacus]
MLASIPGSERFTSRPIPRQELRDKIDPSLELHTIDPEQVEALDPLTYEVVRHRLWAITQEMGETLKRMSGSHAVTESNDFNFTICDELGDQVQVGLFNVGLVGSMDLAIYWTLQHRSRNPGIEEGDMFLCNDPWIGGGLHQNDASVLAPIFYEGKLFGWTTAICHQLDLGGSAPGSWCPTAPDVFSESVPTPPIKVVRNGEIQEDVADAWIRRSRTPMTVGLDLRAKVGANRTAGERILALIKKYGPDVVKAVMARMMNDAEGRLRDRLRSLPDGSWSTVGYQEQSGAGDRGMYPICLTMTKTDDRLTFDFTGTAEQVGMINCPYPGLRAGVVFTLLPILAGDIPWAAGGLLRCFDIVTEEGTITNARFPAAVGKGPVGPSWATGNLVAELLGRMLDAEPETRKDVQSVCTGTFDLVLLAGTDERQDPTAGTPFVSTLFDVMAGGYGAQVHHDGVDSGGRLIIPQARTPDVEMTEYFYPLVALWRREETDSGGPGRHRGGVSGSVLYVAHPYQTERMSLTVSGTGKAANQNVGLAGGYPGNTQLDIVVRGSRIRELFETGVIPERLEELGDGQEILPCEGETYFDPGDALYAHWQGGGGYGDPLLRDPDAVAHDIAEFKVSSSAARDLYGVTVDDLTGAVDLAATEVARRRLREERSERSTQTIARQPAGQRSETAQRRIDDNLVIYGNDDDEIVACGHCGQEIGPYSKANYYELLDRFEGPSSNAGPQIWPHPENYVDNEVVFRQLTCPGCATAILSSVVPASHPLPN